MKKATSRKINKTVKSITKKINRTTRRNPGATVAVGAAIATTSTIGAATIVTGIVRLPGIIKHRFSKVDLGTDNTTTTTTTTTDTTDTTTTTKNDKKNNDKK